MDLDYALKILKDEKVNKDVITLNPKTAYSFLNEYAHLSVEYEIYMDFYGGSKIINEYQINSICNNLNKILNTSN